MALALEGALCGHLKERLLLAAGKAERNLLSKAGEKGTVVVYWQNK